MTQNIRPIQDQIIRERQRAEVVIEQTERQELELYFGIQNGKFDAQEARVEQKRISKELERAKNYARCMSEAYRALGEAENYTI